MDCTGGCNNHRCLNFHEMPQWAQKIVSKNQFERTCELTEVQASGKATIYTPPHINGLDCVPAKKPRVSGGTPEVCVEVNFGSPRPGTEASYVVNGGTTHHIGQHLASGSGTANPETSKSYNIPVRLLLQLMDLDDLAPDLKYVDIEKDLVEMGLVGIVEVDEMPTELLATIGCLGKDGASQLQRYVRE